MTSNKKLNNAMKVMQNMVEHTLGMYANDYVLLPASGLYQEEILQRYKSIIKDCHIYLIGEVPIINIPSIAEKQSCMCFNVELFNGKVKGEAMLPIPAGFIFKQDEENGAYAENTEGQKISPSREQVILQISQQIQPMTFNVLYIGQAYGTDGERNALQRLNEHKTLQEIALRGTTPGYMLQLLLIGLSDNRLFMNMNPFASDTDTKSSNKRISEGIATLHNTSEAERVTLYEAAMIRYFQPRYNKQLKDSFPSTNMKMLTACYERDMQALVAEICYDDFPYLLFSENVAPKETHIAHFELHDEETRKSFFSLSQQPVS